MRQLVNLQTSQKVLNLKVSYTYISKIFPLKFQQLDVNKENHDNLGTAYEDHSTEV